MKSKKMASGFILVLVMAVFAPAQVAAQADNWNNWRALPQDTFGGNVTVQSIVWGSVPGQQRFVGIGHNATIFCYL